MLLSKRCGSLTVFTALALHSRVHASFLDGETLDPAVDVLSWVVLVVAPAVGIAVVWTGILMCGLSTDFFFSVVSKMCMPHAKAD